MGRFKVNEHEAQDLRLNKVLELEGMDNCYTKSERELDFSLNHAELILVSSIDLPVNRGILDSSFKFDGTAFTVVIDGKEYSGTLSLKWTLNLKPKSLIYLISLGLGIDIPEAWTYESKGVKYLALHNGNSYVRVPCNLEPEIGGAFYCVTEKVMQNELEFVILPSEGDDFAFKFTMKDDALTVLQFNMCRYFNLSVSKDLSSIDSTTYY